MRVKSGNTLLNTVDDVISKNRYIVNSYFYLSRSNDIFRIIRKKGSKVSMRPGFMGIRGPGSLLCHRSGDSSEESNKCTCGRTEIVYNKTKLSLPWRYEDSRGRTDHDRIDLLL